MITEELNEFNHAGLPAPRRPAGDRLRPLPPGPRAAAAARGARHRPDEFVIVYHGTVHYANQHEMLSLYLGVKLLQRPRPARSGWSASARPSSAASTRARSAPCATACVELGSVGWREIPGYLALADAFVQPGAPDDFNRYRLPSKLPEFLAMGRPVILPDCNIGHDLVDGEKRCCSSRATALEIAARIEQLLDDAELRGRLAAGAREFALSQLDWEHNSLALGRFLNRVAGVSRRPADARTGGGLTMARPRPLRLRPPRRRGGAPAPARPPRSGGGPARDAAGRRQRLGRRDRRRGAVAAARALRGPRRPRPDRATGPCATSPTPPRRCPGSPRRAAT